MTHRFDDIDGLIGRIRAAARHAGEYQEPPQPVPLAYRQRLGELRDGGDLPIEIDDDTAPELEALLLPSQPDEQFLQRAYAVLLGREPDEEGRLHYLEALPEVGRCHVLAELLCTAECRQRLAAGQLRPRGFQRLTLPLRLQRRLGPLGRLGPMNRWLQGGVQRWYRGLERRWMPELRRRERLRSLSRRLESQEQRIYDILLMLDAELQRQAHHSAKLEQRSLRQERDLQEQARQLERLAQAREPLIEALHVLLPDEDALEPLLHKLESLGAQRRPAASQQQLDDYYLAFEAIFRGDEAQVRENLQRYLPQLQQARACGERALDLGCGRGEWLQMLEEHGFKAHGVDLNATMAAHCRAQGLEVVEDDLLEVLKAQPDGSHALISAFHIAEHLPFDVLYATVAEAGRVLAPGGVLIIETPNPENVLVGSHTFYHDPTHRNPLTPTSLSFLLEFHGFRGLEVLRFNPYPESAKVPGSDPLTERVNGHLCGPQDYALVAVRPAQGEAALPLEERASLEEPQP
ncbi:class I SAM-dependent methyltransferase [uncultured Halomonas sp.]|uniref:class I SAM-dependent methyltransferase n=1 Tax=uncultured Halomonas sp. TaxID=173971 RepID=UPI0026261146|nr:class I SAM-dependent methyltransferase [uncultured Halomonas sp.]